MKVILTAEKKLWIQLFSLKMLLVYTITLTFFAEKNEEFCAAKAPIIFQQKIVARLILCLQEDFKESLLIIFWTYKVCQGYIVFVILSIRLFFCTSVCPFSSIFTSKFCVQSFKLPLL